MFRNRLVHTNLQRCMRGSFLVGTLLFLSLPAYAIDNAVFTKMFHAYSEKVSEFTDSLANALATSKWEETKKIGDELKGMSEEFVALGKKDKDAVWPIYAVNLDHHTVELQDAIAAKDGPELIFLTGVLRDHMGYLQSTNAMWLRDYYPRKMAELVKALEAEDVRASSEAAEALHLGANKIAASAGMQKALYKHTRWLTDIIEVGKLGDMVIGAVQEDDFKAAGEPLGKMKRAFAKWDKSFKM